MSESKQHNCRACRLPIASEATLCHHCGSTQTKSFWTFLGNILKWIGGVTAVLSLLAGVIQLNILIKNWLKNKEAVEAYLKAAELQFNSGDAENAQRLLERAVAIDPASSEARDLQINFLMDEIRKYYFTHWQNSNLQSLNISKNAAGTINYDWGYIKDKSAFEQFLTTNKTYELLAIGAATSTGKRKANILAHLAWLELLLPGDRNSMQIQSLFNEALDEDPDNLFANIMLSAMIGRYSNNSMSDPQKFKEVLKLFQQIPKASDLQQQDRYWMYSMQYEILSSLRLREAEIEMLLLAARTPKEYIFPYAAQKMLRVLDELTDSSNRDNAHEDTEAHLLYKSFSVNALIDLSKTLGEQAFGCLPGPGCSPKIDYNTKFDYYQSMGSLLERAGRNLEALSAYRILQKELAASGRALGKDLTASLENIMARNNIAAIRGISIVKDTYSGLQAGDLIYSFDGQTKISTSMVLDLHRNQADKVPHELRLLRGGEELILMSLDQAPTNARDYVIPAEMIDEKTPPQKRKELFSEWVWIPGAEI